MSTVVVGSVVVVVVVVGSVVVVVVVACVVEVVVVEEVVNIAENPVCWLTLSVEKVTSIVFELNVTAEGTVCPQCLVRK